MTEFPDPALRDVLREDEEIVIELLGLYVSRREANSDTRLPELVARAAEFEDHIRLKLIGVIALYEALRASDSD